MDIILGGLVVFIAYYVVSTKRRIEGIESYINKLGVASDQMHDALGVHGDVIKKIVKDGLEERLEKAKDTINKETGGLSIEEIEMFNSLTVDDFLESSSKNDSEELDLEGADKYNKER